MTDEADKLSMDAPPKLTGKQARFLRALGHGLKPVVQIGKNGLGATVEGQVQECLLAHELIKIKVMENSPQGRDEVALALAQACGASVAQKVGRTILLFRPHPEDPWLQLPKA